MLAWQGVGGSCQTGSGRGCKAGTSRAHSKHFLRHGREISLWVAVFTWARHQPFCFKFRGCCDDHWEWMPNAGDRVGAPEINIGGVAVTRVAIEEWVGGCLYARKVTPGHGLCVPCPEPRIDNRRRETGGYSLTHSPTRRASSRGPPGGQPGSVFSTAASDRPFLPRPTALPS